MHQQARSTPSAVNETTPLSERTGKGRWKCSPVSSSGRAPHRDDLTGEESKQILEQYIAVLNPKVTYVRFFMAYCFFLYVRRVSIDV